MAKTYQQKEEELKKVPKIAAIVALVLIVAFLGSLLVNSNFLRRRVTAVEASGVKFTAADASYFYKEAINEYTNMVYQYLGENASIMLPNSSQSYSSQINESTGTTWEYFFSDNAYTTMRQIGAMYTAAQNSGFVLTEEQEAEFDAQIAEMTAQIEQYYGLSLKEYVKQNYRNTINEKDYLRLSRIRYVVGEYSESVNDAFTYSATELADYYTENKDNLDTFSIRYFTVAAAEGEEVSVAETKANGYVASITNEQEFIDAAREYDAEAYADDDSTLHNALGEYVAGSYAEWAKDAARKVGDITTLAVSEGDTNTSFYVLYFAGRDVNNYATKNYREMVLTQKEVLTSAYTGEDGVFDQAGYDKAVEDARAELEFNATKLLGELRTGSSDAYEERLIELTDNVFNEATGGLYENIEKNRAGIDKQINDWLYSDIKTHGTTQIEDANGAIHIILFLGDGDIYRDSLAEARLRSADFSEWQEQFTDAEGHITFLYRLRVTSMT
ncbi:MAG: hypothetical protein LBN00_04325 [Oscillospiraceae bacterium]|jgi:hypothetical protein|nr:hypothetical protein [Oscillospiraceae bacterium]